MHFLHFTKHLKKIVNHEKHFVEKVCLIIRAHILQKWKICWAPSYFQSIMKWIQLKSLGTSFAKLSYTVANAWDNFDKIIEKLCWHAGCQNVTFLAKLHVCWNNNINLHFIYMRYVWYCVLLVRVQGRKVDYFFYFVVL